MESMRKIITHMGRGLQHRNWCTRKREDLGSWEKELSYLFNEHSDPREDRPLAYRRKGFRHLQHIIQTASDVQLMQLELKHLLWSLLGLYCFFHFLDRQYKKRRDYDRISRLYLNLVHRILFSGILQQEEVLKFIIDFCTDRQLWKRESLVVSIILRPLAAGASVASMLSLLLDRLQQAVERPAQDARNVVRVMYEVFDLRFWPPLDLHAANSIKRLLKMYREWLHMENEKQPIALAPVIRNGLEVVVRCIVERLTNNDLIPILTYMLDWVEGEVSDMEIIIMGNVMEHVALVHVTDLYKNTFSDELFRKLCKIIGSRHNLVSQLGNRVMQLLLDRHDNLNQFISPRIFFQNTHYNVRVCTLNLEDRSFIMKHRSRIHSSIITAIVTHCNYQSILLALFKTMCLLATEIPCGFTAAVFANLAMNIQGVGLEMYTIRSAVKYKLHAIVVSIMSLLCWLHNAPDFYKYTNKIVKLRGEKAPHLNPPMRCSYNFAQHHVVYNLEELFFEDWQVRYSLWMRFRITQAAAFLEAMGAAAPPTQDELATAAATIEPSLVARVQTLTRREVLRPFLPRRPAAAVDVDLDDIETISAEDVHEDSSPDAVSFTDTAHTSSNLLKKSHSLIIPDPSEWQWVRYGSAEPSQQKGAKPTYKK